ncbi:MAG: ABC transporter ATP-binding protein, partial [Clostridia bacterium]|nr:ABC transporter ATP-binding protein [Clostridia bacterium]
MTVTPKTKKQGTLRRVLKYVGRYPLSLCGTILFAILTVAATLCVPVFFGNAVDCMVGKGAVDWRALKTCFIEVGVATAVAALSQWLLSLCNNRISCNVVRDIRKDAFDKLGKLPLQYIDTHSHGDTVSRIVADADQFSDGLLMGFTQFFTGVMTILGTVAFMLITNWKIGLVVVIASPASLLVAKFVTSHTHKFFVEQTRTRGEQTAFVEEAISGLKTTQAFAHEDENEEKFNEINARLEKSSMNAIFYSSLTNPSTRFINNLVYALVAMLGGFAVMGGAFAVGGFTVGGLTKFLSYANQYTKPFNEITGVIAELKGAFTSAARIFELMDEQEEISDTNNAVLGSEQGVSGDVSLRNVDFSYDKKGRLIEDLCLDVKQGQRIAI